MPKSKPTAPQEDPRNALSSLEAILDELASERDARARLLSGEPAEAPKKAGKASKPKKAGKAPEVAPPAEAPAPSGAADPQLARLAGKLEKARAGLAKRDARIADLMAERDALRAEIAEIHASRSWRLTAPLRRLRG